MVNVIFPWQLAQWRQLSQLRERNHLPHALLFSGIAGLGKMQFAKTFAYSLLCLSPQHNGQACEACRTCLLIKAESHPDLLIVEPEEGGQQIKIDQIREVVGFVNETALLAGYRIIILNPANAMNTNAANAILKSLEEPTDKCLFILISDQSARLLATIQSRCQKVQFHKPDHNEALNWLQNELQGHGSELNSQEMCALVLHLSQGAPLKSLEYQDGQLLAQRKELYQSLYLLTQSKTDPISVAARWFESDIRVILGLVQSWLKDLLTCRLTRGEGELINIDHRDSYLHIAKSVSLKGLLHFIGDVQTINRNSVGPFNLNRQLVLEELFIGWVQYVSC